MSQDISRRDFSRCLTVGLGAALSVADGPDAAAQPGKRPNIVFICSDQHGWKYTGCMGHPVVKTPHLDRIAAQGVVFTNAYTGHPLCAPGRASMMTGMFASDCNSFCNSTVWDGRHPLWSAHLNEQGYYCCAIGKMDLNEDVKSGFDEIEVEAGHRRNPDITSLFRRPVAYRVREREDVEGRSRQELHGDAARAQLALSFMRTKGRPDGPWALYVGFTAPHPPFVALERYFDMYPPESVDLPNIPAGHLEALHPVYEGLRHFKRIATPIPEERIRRARAGYYALISELDEYVGQIWDELERTGEIENTLFIYTSDHGESLGEHGLWYKNNLYDVAARVPLIMAGAGLPKSLRVDTPVAHVDLIATILDRVGSDKATKLRGHSLLPMMSGQPGNHPGFAYSECHSEGNGAGSFMIRKGEWKFIHFTWHDDLLFNVAQDPGEFNNIIEKPGMADICAELKEILHSQVDPEQVTIRAFQAQERMLRDFAERMTEEQLFGLFKSRLGPGLARTMAAKCKGR